MGLLAPLYALAALAIAGPIVLHLIRRQPQGQILFSSLMFLRTSPPRLTRRSRLDNLLLLLLRGLALLMIALAFSRPYWRTTNLIDQVGPSRTVAILLDVSASMQRSDVWQAAIKECQQVLADLSEQDQVALYTIDHQLKPIVSVGELSQATQSSEVAALKSQVVSALGAIRPTWNGSNLSVGLIGLAEQLNTRGLGANPAVVTDSQIVLISDFHIESGVDELQGYAWPQQIDIDLRIVADNQLGNARASLMQPDETSAKPVLETKIRIENNSHSQGDSFNLQWTDPQGTALGPATAIQVTAGQVRVITMPAKPERANQVRLTGDGWSGDNTVYVPSSHPVDQRIVYSGNKGERPEDDLSYFLSQAPFSTQMFRRQIAQIPPEDLAQLSVAEDVVAAVIEPTTDILPQVDQLRKFAERGGSVVVVLSEQSAELADVEQFLSSLFRTSTAADDNLKFNVKESANDQHAMISFVDYRSAVFSTLADPRFNDFSKIRIWKHRMVQWTGLGNDLSQPPIATDSQSNQSMPRPEVIARLDDQSPWLVRGRLGSGNVWLLTCGWQTSESSFALSSKFIPVMMRLLDPNPRENSFSRVVDVGQSINLEDSPPFTITNHLGQSVDSSLATADNTFQFSEPGLYNIRGAQWDQQLAVQIPAHESRLTPMDASVLQQFGLGVEKLESETEIQQRLRQMKIEELEGQQRLWKWLLVAGLGILLLETACAGWAARKL